MIEYPTVLGDHPGTLLLQWKEWIEKVEDKLFIYGFEFNKKVLGFDILQDIALNERIKCFYTRKIPKGFPSQLYRRGDDLIILVNKGKLNRAKWFLLGHELGHHFQYMINHIPRDYLGKMNFEIQANIFAYHCFLPDEEMGKMVKKEDGYVKRILKQSNKKPNSEDNEEISDFNKEIVVKATLEKSVKKLQPLDKENPLGNTALEILHQFAEFMYDWYEFRQNPREYRKKKILSEAPDMKSFFSFQD